MLSVIVAILLAPEMAEAPCLWFDAMQATRYLLPQSMCSWLQASPASPIHGPNQWPTQRPTFDTALREYIDSMLHLGQHLMRGEAPDQSFPILQADSLLMSEVHRL